MTQQINGNLDDPNIRKLFESKNFVFLSSLMKDGSPQVTPMWVDIENGYIFVNTAIGRLKQKNISRDPRVVTKLKINLFEVGRRSMNRF